MNYDEIKEIIEIRRQAYKKYFDLLKKVLTDEASLEEKREFSEAKKIVIFDINDRLKNMQNERWTRDE